MKIKQEEFWQYIYDLREFRLRVFPKNIFVDRRGRLYPISSRNYEWGKKPVIYLDQNEENKDPYSARRNLMECLDGFDPINYIPNATLSDGRRSCNTAIFALNIARRFDYDLDNWEAIGRGFNEMETVFRYLCN